MKLDYIWLFLKIAILILLQVWFFNYLFLFRYATPFPYVAILLLFPIATSKVKMTLLGGVVGLLLDLLSTTPGLHTAAFTFAAFCRNYLLQLFIDADTDTMRPLPFRGKFEASLLLLLLLILIHHTIFFGLDAIGGISVQYLLLRLFSSSAFSLVVALIFLFLFSSQRVKKGQ